MALRLGMAAEALSAAHHADPEHEVADGAYQSGGSGAAQANGDLTTATAVVTKFKEEKLTK